MATASLPMLPRTPGRATILFTLGLLLLLLLLHLCHVK